MKTLRDPKIGELILSILREKGIRQKQLAELCEVNGGDISTLSELLGHADISITKKRYAHLSQEHKQAVVIKFAMEV